MAPLTEQVVTLMKREDGCGAGHYRGRDGLCYTYSGWYWWGRWVFAALAILFVILLLFAMFRNSRRRRKLGLQPMYGTGWMAPPPQYYPPPPQYAAQDPHAGNPPPGGYKYGQGDGYGNHEGIQLQQPTSAYHRGPDADYAPPPGPPPNHGK